MPTSILLERVIKKPKQIKVLYELLENRKYSISNLKPTSFTEHSRFVISHPYRAWYIISFNNKYIGTTYLQKNNAISINLTEGNYNFTTDILGQLFKLWKPLKPIQSVRPKNFYINVSPENNALKKEIEKLGGKHIQNTYSL